MDIEIILRATLDSGGLWRNDRRVDEEATRMDSRNLQALAQIGKSTSGLRVTALDELQIVAEEVDGRAHGRMDGVQPEDETRLRLFGADDRGARLRGDNPAVVKEAGQRSHVKTSQIPPHSDAHKG